MNSETETQTEKKLAPLKDRGIAWGVHLFTMSGLVFATLAVLALFNEQYAMLWLWLAIALVIDGVDGTLARHFRVKEALPWFDGGVLDILIDYMTWTFIPAIFMYKALSLGPEPVAAVLMILIMTSSTLCYANEHWKSVDYYFYGFPAAWNIVAVVLYVLQTGAVVNVVATTVLILLTVAPTYWTHPFRVKRFMMVNLVAIIGWISATGYLVAVYPEQPIGAFAVFYITGGWFLLTGLIRTITGPDRPKKLVQQ
ncbi:MAG: CDP-alcohol phosphatidyltransferase family protein [Arcanobacterium sp.]